MRQYELMVILDADLEERTVAPSLDRFLNVIRQGGGTVEKTDIWGRRRLAYDINKKSEGIYAVVDLVATPELAKELDRQLGLNESVLRTKLMRTDTGTSKEKARRAAKKLAAAESDTPTTSAPPAVPPAPAAGASRGGRGAGPGSRPGGSSGPSGPRRPAGAPAPETSAPAPAPAAPGGGTPTPGPTPRPTPRPASS